MDFDVPLFTVMTGLYFTDQHVYPYNEFSKPTENGRTTLIQEHDDTYLWVANSIRESRPDFVVYLGDTALTHGYLDALSLTCIEKGYQEVREACRETGAALFWMTGNHDFHNDASRVHVLPFIKEIVNEIDVRDGLLFVPFYRDETGWKGYQEYVQSYQIKRAFIHLEEVVGARYNGSKKACSGGILPGSFEQTKTFAGHFHHPQDLSPSFHVIGSCCYRNFSDDVVPGMPRGLVIDRDGILERRENPHTSIYRTLRQENDDPEGFRRLLEQAGDHSRMFARVIYPQALHSIVEERAGWFKGLKTVPLKERKKTHAAPVALPSALDPHAVVDACLKMFPPEEGLAEGCLKYGHAVVDEVLGKTLVQKHRKVTILGARVEGFLSIQCMDIRYDTVGVIYIDGQIEGKEADVSNGSGKSAMIEAPYWCLFGSLVRPKEKTSRTKVDNVINNKSKSCLVSLMLDVDGVEYQITRTRKHPVHGDNLLIYLNGKLESQGTQASEKYLGQLIGIDGETFRHVAMFADSMQTRFSSLGGRERMELVEAVTQLHAYDGLYDVLLKRTTEATNNLTANSVSLSRSQSAHSEISNSLTANETILRESIAQIETLIEKKRSEIYEASVAAEAISAELEKKSSLLSSATASVAQGKSLVGHHIKRQEEASRALSSLVSRETSLSLSLSNARALNAGTCPTCGKPNSQVTDVSQLEEDLRGTKELQAAWEKEYTEATQAMSDARLALSETEGNLRALEAKMRPMQDSLGLYRSNIRTGNSEIDVLTRQIEGYRKTIHGQWDRVHVLEAEIQRLSSEKESLQAVAKTCQYWADSFSPKGGCRVWLANDALRQLSDHAVDYASYLSDGTAVPALSINSSNAIVLDVQTQAADYTNSSSGERRMIDLALQFAFSILASRFSGFSCNLLSLDEVEDKLDGAARRRLIGLLNRIASSEGKVILIASQYRDLRSYVDRVWVVRKSDEVSRLVDAA